MSSQWQLPGWGSRNAKPDETPASSSNGVVDAPMIGAVNGPDAVVAPDRDPDAGMTPPPADSPAAASAMAAEAAAVEPVASDGQPAQNPPVASGPAEGAGGEAAATPEDGPAFLAKLARAMHTTAARERARVIDEVERRRAAHVQAIRERATSEAERIRELAADDLKAIDVWAEGEAKRIKAERDQREKALNEDLELSLKEHAGIIDRQVAAAETAIAEYRNEAEAFFAKLDRENDPVEIARQANLHPVFPTLPADAGAAPAAVDAAGPAMVGVMGQAESNGAAGAAGSMPWPRPVLIGASPSHGQPGAREAVGAAAGSPGASSAESPLDSLLAPRPE